VWGKLGSLAQGVQSVTLGFKERLAPEDFLGCLAFLDPQDLLVPRETEESRETGARLEWGWKVRWVLRDLTDCRVLQVLESQVSRGCGVLLASKVCAAWWEGLDLWGPQATASFVRLYKCRQTEAQARKDNMEMNTDFETWKTELITARVVTFAIVVWNWIDSIVIIEQFVTNIYNFDKRVNL